MKTFDINDHFGPLDRSILDSKDDYRHYFYLVKMVLNAVLSSLSRLEERDPIEVKAIRSFGIKLLATIDGFSLKAAYSNSQPLLVDVTESGFPNYLEFKRLEDDLQNSEKYLAAFPSSPELKKMILEYIFKNLHVPNDLIKKLSYVSYLENLVEWKVFREYNAGKLEFLKSFGNDKKIRRFVYNWASFDSVTNRPYIYILIFDNPENANDEHSVEGKDFEETIRKLTHNSAPLKVIASDIDEHFENVHPKILKRIDFGPIFSKYSKDDNPYTKVVKGSGQNDDFILNYTTEVVFSVGEKKNNSFFSSGELRQIFYIDESNKECMDRMVSQVHNYLITSHEVLQHLSEKHPDILKNLSTLPYVFSKDQLWKEMTHRSS